METVTFEVGVAAAAQLADGAYPLRYEAVKSGQEEVTHRFFGFGGREVHLVTNGRGTPHDTARVASFRRFEYEEYERKGASMTRHAALERFDELAVR